MKIIFRLRPGLKLVLSIIQADLQCVNNNTFAHQGFSAEQLKVECRTNDCLMKKHKQEHNSKTTIWSKRRWNFLLLFYKKNSVFAMCNKI